MEEIRHFFALSREACYKGDGDNIKNSGKRKKVKRVKEWEKEKVLWEKVCACVIQNRK